MSNPNTAPSQVLTIAELECKEDVAASDIWETLQSYAASGHSIRATVITEALDRCEPTGLDLEDIQEAATDGIITLARNSIHSSAETVCREQAEYAHVIGYAGLKLEALAQE
jgi:hypothetical protein